MFPLELRSALTSFAPNTAPCFGRSPELRRHLHFVRGGTVPIGIHSLDDVEVCLAGGHVGIRIGGRGHGRRVERRCAFATRACSPIDVVGHSCGRHGGPLQQNRVRSRAGQADRRRGIRRVARDRHAGAAHCARRCGRKCHSQSHGLETESLSWKMAGRTIGSPGSLVYGRGHPEDQKALKMMAGPLSRKCFER